MILRRDLLLEIGGFDEALDTGKPLPGGGDLDIFYRVIRAATRWSMSLHVRSFISIAGT
jgi:hypothetical protein